MASCQCPNGWPTVFHVSSCLGKMVELTYSAHHGTRTAAAIPARSLLPQFWPALDALSRFALHQAEARSIHLLKADKAHLKLLEAYRWHQIFNGFVCALSAATCCRALQT